MYTKSKSTPTKAASSRGRPGSSEASAYFMNLPLKEKRRYYKCREGFKTLSDLIIYTALVKFNQKHIQQLADRSYWEERNFEENQFEPSKKINEKICLHHGDITTLEIDAIVNAANPTLLGGGGVDGAIHKAAGSTLVEECELLNGCSIGFSKITGGHKLPAKYVIHTVGPTNRNEEALVSCYETCLQLVLDYKIRSVAFCCIATGVYGYRNRDAAHVALHTLRKWLEQHQDKVDRIIFCTFLEIDFNVYLELMATRYFPVPSKCKIGRENEQRQDQLVRELHDRLMAQSMSDIQLTRKPPELLIEDTGNKPKRPERYNKNNSKSNFSNESRGTYDFQYSFNQQGDNRAHAMGTYTCDHHNVSSDLYPKYSEDRRHSYGDQSGTHFVERNRKLYKEGQITPSGGNYKVSYKTQCSRAPQGSPTEFLYVHQYIKLPKDNKQSAYMNDYLLYPVTPDHSGGKALAEHK